MDFDQASRVHYEWKTKLRNYLAKPDGSLVPGTVGQDNECALGKWLHGEAKKFAGDPAYDELLSAHAGFHQAAASLVKRADSGERVDGEALLGSSSRFNQLSQRVTILIMEMKRKVPAPAGR